MTSDKITVERGQIEFDSVQNESFNKLVQQTLNESDFIETKDWTSGVQQLVTIFETYDRSDVTWHIEIITSGSMDKEFDEAFGTLEEAKEFVIDDVIDPDLTLDDFNEESDGTHTLVQFGSPEETKCYRVEPRIEGVCL